MSWFVVAGLLGTFTGRILLFAGLRRIGPVRTASIANTAPIVTIGIAVVALGEQLSPTALVAVALVLIGLGVLTIEAFQTPDPTIARATYWAGIRVDGEGSIVRRGDRRSTARRAIVRLGTPALVGIGLAALSAVSVGMARVARRVGLDTMPDPLVGAMLGSVTALVSNLLLQAWQGRLRSVVLASFREIRPRLWLAGVCATIGVLAFFQAIRLAPLSHVAVIAASETIITLVVGSLLLRKSERLSIRVAIPALCVFAGGILVALG
jgi:drug/metabolite transporter (DMT)-like permease